jgi:hypothetical protein
MAENKTIATTSSVDAYIEAIGDETRRKDCSTLAKLMARATSTSPSCGGRASSDSAAVTTSGPA